MKDQLLGIIRNFPKKKILVVGDVMVDQFIWGSVERISPEAPVPVVKVEEEEVRAGGAANVAFNIIGLGGEVHLAGIVGDDHAAGTILEKLGKAGIGHSLIFTEKSRPTTVKTRVIAHSQQVVRFDRESRQVLGMAVKRELVEKIERSIGEFGAVIVSDYGKGVVGRLLMDRLREAAKKREPSLPWIPRCATPGVTTMLIW